MNADRLHIAAGVIYSRDRARVLIARRPDHLHQGGLWEFPGGKLLPGENARQALSRELYEELNLRVERAAPLMDISYDYPDLAVRLDVWSVTEWGGEPHGREGQLIEWVAIDQLSGREFPAANRPVVRAICLPRLYLITPSGLKYDDPFYCLLERLLTAGVNLLQLRDRDLDPQRLDEVAGRLAETCRRYRCRLLINAGGADAVRSGAAGIHLSSTELLKLTVRPLAEDFLVSASCHNTMELEHAARIGVDFAVLGPVLPTSSHPLATPMGWDRFRALTRVAQFPVYALGGMSPLHAAMARRNGAHGVAMISGVWDSADPAAAVRTCLG